MLRLVPLLSGNTFSAQCRAERIRMGFVLAAVVATAIAGCGQQESLQEITHSTRRTAEDPERATEIVLASQWEPSIEPAADPLAEFDRAITPREVPFPQFLIALDKHTGKLRWKRPRDGAHSYSTPLLIEHAGLPQIVSVSGHGVAAYEPQTGRELWWCRHDGHSVVPRPIYANGFVYICTGYTTPQMSAIDPSGEDDVTDTHIHWTIDRGIPFNASPIAVDGAIYFVSDVGVLTCCAADDGTVRWKKRLQGHFSASPVEVDGRLFFVSDQGTTYIVKPGDRFDLVASNALDGYTQASPAVSGRSLIYRTETHLYRIEAAGGESSDSAADPGDVEIDWPQFRGPGGQGHAGAHGVPLEWSEERNVVWKVEIPGHGWSSPVVSGDQIWLTTAVEDDQGRTTLKALCIDRESGEIEHDVAVFRKSDAGSIHRRNSHATPTPAIDGDRVVVHFGAHGTAGLDREGKVVWRTRVPFHHHHGPAGSPIVVGDLVVFNCDGFEGPYDEEGFRAAGAVEPVEEEPDVE